MPQRDAFSQVQVDVNAGSAPHAARPSDDTPFHVVVLGDFSGGSSSGQANSPASGALVERRPIRIDRDDLDSALTRLSPELVLDIGAQQPLRVRFSSLDDFHPDRLHARLPIFAALRDLRKRLADPAGFARAARAIAPAGTGVDVPDSTSAPSVGATASRMASGSLLDDILAAAPDSDPRPTGDRHAPSGHDDDLPAFLRSIVSPHLVPDADPRQKELLASVDAATAALLRVILKNSSFRALEALWRGLDLLVRRVETDSRLRLALLDVSRDELAAAVRSQTASGMDGVLHRMLDSGARSLPDGAPWSLIVGLHPAANDATTAEDEIALLDGMARVAASCGAPFITAAPAAVLHPESARSAAGWETLRHSSQARWLGLVHPALLLRLPYGEEGDPCDGLAHFEELEPGQDAAGATRSLLWGSPALMPALVLCAAFASDGWAMRPADHVEVDRLPLYLHHVDGSVSAVPPNGRLLGDDDVLRLLEAGVMPVVARREGDAVRLASLQSVASPPAPLEGRWRASPL